MKIKRTVYFDVLNVIACIAVLALHHNGIVHYFKVDTPSWKQALVFEVLFYWAVPIFFMLSGATLLNYREKYSTRVFFKKRVFRVAVPFLFWSVILLIHTYFQDKFIYKTPQEVINAIIQTKLPYGDVYWFFSPLLALYFLIPVLSLLKEHKIILWYIVLFIFITHSLFPPVLSMLGIKWNNSLSFPMVGYVIFLVLGYLLSQLTLSKLHRNVIYCIALLCIIIRYWGTYYFSLELGKLDRYLFGYVQFHSVFLAVAVFIFIKNLDFSAKTCQVLSVLSSYSFGIYLIHKLVMYYEQKFLLLSSEALFWRTLGIFITYLICLLCVYLIKQVPILGKYIV
ncbi:acyltransferase [[Pasteurella] aerogenes]